jgi:hypothetical protein
VPTDDAGLPLPFPRNLIVAGEASQVRVVETSPGSPGRRRGVYLSSPVTELVAGPGAVVDHYKVQRESPRAFHLAAFQIQGERAANVSSHSISIGGAIVRNDVGGVLDGEGGDCTLNGLYLGAGEQVVDNHMRVDHVAAHCSSARALQGDPRRQGRAVFNGLIHVHPGAQKTDAKQTNRNLLLSRRGAGQLEPAARDLRRRRALHPRLDGRPARRGRRLLPALAGHRRGGGEEPADLRLRQRHRPADRVEPVRHELEEILFARLPRGEVVRQAV